LLNFVDFLPKLLLIYFFTCKCNDAGAAGALFPVIGCARDIDVPRNFEDDFVTESLKFVR
jgi:hypothetical protein